MPNYRMVFEFNENNGAGFNEVYYRTAGSITDAATVPPGIITRRLNNLNYLNTFARIRITQLGLLRATSVVPIGQRGQNTDARDGLLGTASNMAPLPVGAAIVCSLQGLNGGSRKLWMRGANQGDYQRDATTGLDAFHPAFVKDLKAMVGQMGAAGFGILQVGKVTPAVNPAVALVSIDGSRKDGTSDLTTAGNVALDASQRIIITRTSKKDFPGLNGHFSVLSATPPKYKIPYQTPGGAGPVPVSGFAHAEIYGTVSTFVGATAIPDHLGTRTSRSPLTRSRGAKRAARIRQSV